MDMSLTLTYGQWRRPLDIGCIVWVSRRCKHHQHQQPRDQSLDEDSLEQGDARARAGHPQAGGASQVWGARGGD